MAMQSIWRLSAAIYGEDIGKLGVGGDPLYYIVCMYRDSRSLQNLVAISRRYCQPLVTLKQVV